MIRVLHLVRDILDDMWMFDTLHNGLDWGDTEDIISILAKPHFDTVEVKVLYRNDLNTVDEHASFDLLWEDRGTPQELKDAFEACFAFADSIK